MSVMSLSRGWRWLVAAAWALCLLAALPYASEVNARLDATARLAGSESAAVTRALRDRFRSPFAELVLLRVAAAPSPLTADGRAMLEQVTHALQATRGAAGVLSYLESEDATFIGKDGSSIVIVGVNAQQGGANAQEGGVNAQQGPLGAQQGPIDALIPRLQAATDALRLQLRARYPEIAFRWTGEAAVNADIRRESSEETRSAELRVFPITLLLLLIAFRSVISALLPLLCGALTMVIVLGLAVAVNRFWPLSVILVSIVTMVGLGLSIDYALLMISRYRDALDEGMSRGAAIAEASERGGRTVIVSGTAVAIGFAAMLLVRVNEVRSIGVGGLLVTTVSVLVATTLLPLVLAWIGPWIDAGRIGRPRRNDRARRHDGERPHDRALYWGRWASWVGRHPLGVLAVAGLPLLFLAFQATRLRMDLPRGAWLPANVESVRVLHELDSIGRGNVGQTIRLIVDLPAGATVESEPGWNAVSNLATAFMKDSRVAHVWAITTLSGGEFGASGPEMLAMLPEPVRRTLVSVDARAALVELLPREGLSPADAAAFVREIRAANCEALTKLPGTRLEVGGVPAFNADYEDAISNALLRVVLSVICATLVVLALAFRSALIPLKAVALNLLSVAAAFGAVVLVFQDGHGLGLLGLDRPLEGGFPILPVLVFCAVFGLSMDYEVFLVARVADGHRAGLSDRAAVAEGLASTGRVITLAAAIMVAIFGGFVLGNFVLIKILGFALGVAVLLDATLVRLALGPACICLAGRFNWWPGERGKSNDT
jgi:RND superfamily putative drug exporter